MSWQYGKMKIIYKYLDKMNLTTLSRRKPMRGDEYLWTNSYWNRLSLDTMVTSRILLMLWTSVWAHCRQRLIRTGTLSGRTKCSLSEIGTIYLTKNLLIFFLQKNRPKKMENNTLQGRRPPWQNEFRLRELRRSWTYLRYRSVTHFAMDWYRSVPDSNRKVQTDTLT